MLSRVAESLFWLGRNVERAETIARILDVSYTRAMDLYSRDDGRYERLWRSVMQCGGFVAEPKPSAPGIAAHEALAHCVFDRGNSNSIVSAIHVARSNALGIRAELTTELWVVINVLYLSVEGQSLRSALREGPARFLRRVCESTQALAGVADATLSHGDVWRFLQAGRFLERAFMTARMLQAIEVEHEPWHESQRLLEMCCASEPFVHDMRYVPEPRDALAFIALAADCPRSLRFSFRELGNALHGISDNREGTFGTEPERRLGKLCARLDFASADELFAPGVNIFARDTVAEIVALSGDVETAYFPRLPIGIGNL
jgi:uncharacterized alpha-E superfamily protein